MFAELEEKIVVIVLIILVLAAGIGSWYYRGLQIDKLQQANAVAAAANKSLVTAVKVDTVTEQVTQTVNAKVDANITKVDTNHNKLINSVTQKIQTNDQKFNNSSDTKTPELIDQNQTRDSEILITGLWDQYCSNMPNAQQCKV